MSIFDIIGPIMVGPSSSHTAGACRIGLVARRLLGEDVIHAEILLHGSFLATGKGHGTDKAIVAGLLGFPVDDSRIPRSLEIAAASGVAIQFGRIDLGGDAHPNSAKLLLTGTSGKTLELVASSIGGGQIMINEIDGLTTNFSGNYPTLIVHNLDQPGLVAMVTSILQQESVNIATMQLYRSQRGGSAVMVLECDQEVPAESVHQLEQLEGIVSITYFGAT